MICECGVVWCGDLASKLEGLDAKDVPVGGLEGQKSDTAYNEAVNNGHWGPGGNGDAFSTLASVQCGVL